MRLFFSIALLISFTLVSAQPELTLWRVQDGHNQSDNHNDGHEAELYECGSYYFFVSDGVETSSWSIKNEGASDLVLQLPLGFDPTSATSMEISQQPDKAVLAPGEETIFKIKYDFYGIHGDVFLDINSNDPDHANCGLLVGGNVLACTCYCTPSGIAESLGFCTKVSSATEVGAAAGIPLFDQPCDPPSVDRREEGGSCQPISIADPCSCDNTITTPGGMLLFRDTLSVSTTGGTELFLTANTLGFLDANGVPVSTGTSLGTADNTTNILTYVFYRVSGEGVDIRVSGVPFMSTLGCPDASTCAPDPVEIVPTMGEWTLIMLGLIMLIFSVLGVKVTTKATLKS